MKLFASALLVLSLACAGAALAGYWGLVACSTSDSAAPFYYNWETGQFELGPSLTLPAFGNYPYDAVMRPWGETEVWIPGAVGDGVVVVNELGEVHKELATGEYPISVAFSPRHDIALVSCRDSDRLDIVDINTYEVVGNLPIPGTSLGPGQLIYDPQGERFFLAEYYGDMLYTIAPDGSEILNQASVGSSLWQLVIDPMVATALFVTDRGTDQVRVIDPGTLTQIDAVDVGDDPWGLDIDFDQLVVTCEDSHEVYFIDAFSLETIVVPLALDADPRDVNIATGIMTVGGKTLIGGAAYVCGGQTSSGSPVYVIDLYSHGIIHTIMAPGTSTNAVAVEAQWPLPSAVDDLPGARALDVHAAPNPFNPRTEIRFTLDEPAAVTLAVFDVAGHLVRRVEAGTMAAGARAWSWDGTDRRGRRLAGGTYLVLVQAGELVAGAKVQLVP